MRSSADHHQVRARFSAAARTYTNASALQDRVARKVLDLVPEGFAVHHALDAGCGPGRLLALARERWPLAAMVGVDIAPGMIAVARERWPDDPRVRLVESDIRSFEEPGAYDLVLSSSALHWLDPFPDGLTKVARLCRPGGLLAIGIMLNGTLRELHAARAAVAPDKPVANRLPDLEELEQSIRSIPGTRIRRLEQVHSEYDQASADEVLKSLHAMGVTGGTLSRSRRPLTRSELDGLKTWYHQNFASPGGVRVTFHVGYVLLERDQTF